VSVIGDLTADETYRAVGLALSRWESLEVSLADLYVIFHKLPFSTRLVQGFGDLHPTFTWRMTGLEKAAAQYFFVRHPDQTDEGNFRELAQRVRDAAITRHRVAHGLVQEIDVQELSDDGGRVVALHRRWVLLAPLYGEIRLEQVDSLGLGAKEILQVSEQFVTLADEVLAFLNYLLRKSSP
jgi:hypothetical protein